MTIKMYLLYTYLLKKEYLCTCSACHPKKSFYIAQLTIRPKTTAEKELVAIQINVILQDVYIRAKQHLLILSKCHPEFQNQLEGYFSIIQIYIAQMATLSRLQNTLKFPHMA